MRTMTNIAGSAALILVSSGLAMIATEVAARYLFPEWAPRTGRLASFWQHDPIVGWAHRPLQTGRFESYGFSTSVRINSHGYRGPEIEYEKPDDVRRVVVLGDSFVWGFGVEEQDIFTSRLGQSLGSGVEVVNLGVSGYSTDQELLIYRSEGRRYSPDLVVLVVAANDIANNVTDTAYVVYGKPLFRLLGDELVLTNQPVPTTPGVRRAIFGLATQSYVLNELNRTLEARRIDQASTEDRVVTSRVAPAMSRTDAERMTMRLLSEIRAEVEADKARFLVVLVDRIYGGENFRLALNDVGIRYLALDDYLPLAGEPMHIPDGLHWNAAGHRVVSKAIESFVLREFPEYRSGAQ